MNWISVNGHVPELGYPVIGFNDTWIDEDFNPKGTRECVPADNKSGWVTAKWNASDDYYMTTEDDVPTHYLEIDVSTLIPKV